MPNHQRLPKSVLKTEQELLLSIGYTAPEYQITSCFRKCQRCRFYAGANIHTVDRIIDMLHVNRYTRKIHN